MRFRSAISAAALAAVLATALGGCSEYLDRRDTVSLQSGEAMAANRVTMTIDPWSRASSQNYIAYNGQKAARASERYRTGKVIPPVSMTTSSAGYQNQAPDSGSGNNNSTPPSGANGNNPSP
jgi:hypothetical protein